MTPEKARSILNRLSEHDADLDQLLSRLNQVYTLSIESEVEKINPRLLEPVKVRERNLPVARQVVMDIYTITRELARIAAGVEASSGAPVRYELIKSFVDPTEDWKPE